MKSSVGLVITTAIVFSVFALAGVMYGLFLGQYRECVSMRDAWYGMYTQCDQRQSQVFSSGTACLEEN